MSKEKKAFYNPEKEITELYTKVKILEKIKIRNINDLIVENTYWKDPDGELWVDFDNPTENKEMNFNAYRNRVGFMQPSEIKNLRKKFNLSVREFSKPLGIGASNLSRIENNKVIQTEYQDTLFKFIKNKPKIFKMILKEHSDNNLIDIINSNHQKDYEVEKQTNTEKNSFLSTFSYADNMLGDAA